MKKFLAFSLAIILVAALMVIGCSSPAPSPTTSAAPPPPVTSTQPTTSAPPATSTAPSTTSTPPATSSAPSTSPAKLPAKIIMGTHAVGTAVYSAATILAKVSSEYSGMLVVIQPTSGPPVWVPQMVTTGTPQIGVSHTLDAWWQYSGKVSPVPVTDNLLGNTPFYKQAYTNMRMIASPWVLAIGEIVRADSPIKSFADLKVKKYRIPSGFTSQPSAYASTIADFIDEGLTMENFTPVPVANIPAAVKAFQQGQVDLTNAACNFPLIDQMAATTPVRYLSASDNPADVAKVSAFFPDATYQTYPAGSATGIDQPTVLFTAPYVVETTTSTPDNVVEALLNSWWNHIDELRQQGGLSYSKLMSPEQLMLKEPPIPYAQGAINFYKSKGIWTSAMQDYQDQLLNGVFPFAQK